MLSFSVVLAGALLSGCSSADCVSVPASVTQDIESGIERGISITRAQAIESTIGHGQSALVVAAELTNGTDAVWRVGWNGTRAGPIFSNGAYAAEISDWPLDERERDFDEQRAAESCL